MKTTTLPRYYHKNYHTLESVFSKFYMYCGSCGSKIGIRYMIAAHFLGAAAIKGGICYEFTTTHFLTSRTRSQYRFCDTKKCGSRKLPQIEKTRNEKSRNPLFPGIAVTSGVIS